MTDQQISETVAKILGWDKMTWKMAGAKPCTFWKRGTEERPSAPNYCENMGRASEILERVEGYKDLIGQTDGAWLVYFHAADGDYSVDRKLSKAICMEFLKLHKINPGG